MKKLLSAGETVNLTVTDEGGLTVTSIGNSQMQLLGWGDVSALRMPNAKGFAIELETITLMSGNETHMSFGTSLNINHGVNIHTDNNKFNVTHSDYGTIIVTPMQTTVDNKVINYLGWQYPPD